MTLPNGGSLSDKLKSLGVKVGATDLPAPQPASRYEVHDVIPGRYVPTPQGETFVAETLHPAGTRHGNLPIWLSAPLTGLAAWANDPLLLEIPRDEIVFLDTETSGLAGGTGTYAFMIGAARYEAEAFSVKQFFMRTPSEEPALLEALAQFLAPCKAIVTFNGKAFDVPLLQTRYTLHRQPSPLKEIHSHIDLLPLARRLWRDRLPSRALKALELDIMNAPRGMEEVPGYEVPYLYFDYLRTADARPLKGVFYHNQLDVVAMAALLQHTAQLLADPFHAELEHGLDIIALAKLFEDLGQHDHAARLFERGLEMTLPETDFWTATKRLSILQRRRGDLANALELWQRAAGQGHIYAHVELAKYHEHTRKDPATALEWTRSAIQQVETGSLPGYMRKHWLDELQHRQARLTSKIKK